jgi:hypothetical protein
VRVENPITWFRDEFRRENLEARERRAVRSSKHLEHPVLYAAVLAGFWGTLVWVLEGRDTDVGWLVILVVISAFYGVAMLWWARRWNHKQRRASAQSAPNGS